MKKIIIIFTLCTLLLTACAGKTPTGQNSTTSGTANNNTVSNGTTAQTTTPEPQPSPTSPAEVPLKISDYFPFVNDVHMKYKGTGNEYAAYDTYVDYVRDNKMQTRENNGGTETIKVYTLKDGALARSYSRGETYYRFDYTSMTDGEDVLLKEPLVAGTSWTAKDGSSRSITAVDKQIETPAGNFSAIEVTTTRKDSVNKDYYVKGTGLVKTEYISGDASMTVLSELEKVEKDVPFKHIVKFYFPQFNEDRIIYMEREIEIKTNEDMKYKFQKELKTIPESGGLVKTLTKNTQVLGVSLDDEKDTVTVDLSTDFVNEMNAGTTLEVMLLNSVTNTFGNYYMKSKVIITLDGKPYESGHILMKPGEAFNVKAKGIVQYE